MGDSLSNMEIKLDMYKKRKITDTVYTNAGGFFTQMAGTSGIQCPYILLEAKNYAFDLENPEFDQISGRLINEVGKFGLLVCRTVDDEKAVKERCETFLTDNRKHVIVLTDNEILYLLDLRADSDTRGINDFMDRKIRSLRFRSKK
jgi:hypothetical protein